MSEMIERVARACFASAMRDVHPNHAVSWDALPEKYRANHRHTARAAIEAMLEPTQAMCKAPSVGHPSESEMAMSKAIYCAMLTEALK